MNAQSTPLTNPQVEIYERLIEIAKGGDRKAVIAALRVEIGKLTGDMFALCPAEPLVDVSAKFEEFWKAYPKRKGANPRHPAEKRFAAAVGRGSDPDQIIAGARNYATLDRQNINTPLIAQAQTWLHQRRWQDYTTRVPTGLDPKEAKRLAAIAENAVFFR